jgi:hypothetical protein
MVLLVLFRVIFRLRRSTITLHAFLGVFRQFFANLSNLFLVDFVCFILSKRKTEKVGEAYKKKKGRGDLNSEPSPTHLHTLRPLLDTDGHAYARAVNTCSCIVQGGRCGFPPCECMMR